MIYTISNYPGSPSFELEQGDLCIIREIFDENVYKFVPQPGWRVLDIGAHKGVFSVYAALRGAIVTAYEPNPPSFAALKANLARNGVEAVVEARNMGVWSAPGTLFLHQNQISSGGSTMLPIGGNGVPSTEAQEGGVLVPVISWEDAIGDQPWELVKLDAEGIEFELLCNSTQEQLRRIKRLTIEVHNDRATDSQYQQMIRNIAQAFVHTGIAESNGKLNYIYATSRW